MMQQPFFRLEKLPNDLGIFDPLLDADARDGRERLIVVRQRTTLLHIPVDKTTIDAILRGGQVKRVAFEESWIPGIPILTHLLRS